MCLVVVGGNIFAVPTAGKHNLNTDTIRAVSVHELLVGHEMPKQRRFCGTVVVQAIKANRLLRECQLAEFVATPSILVGVGLPGKVT